MQIIIRATKFHRTFVCPLCSMKGWFRDSIFSGVRSFCTLHTCATEWQPSFNVFCIYANRPVSPHPPTRFVYKKKRKPHILLSIHCVSTSIDWWCDQKDYYILNIDLFVSSWQKNSEYCVCIDFGFRTNVWRTTVFRCTWHGICKHIEFHIFSSSYFDLGFWMRIYRVSVRCLNRENVELIRETRNSLQKLYTNSYAVNYYWNIISGEFNSAIRIHKKSKH